MRVAACHDAATWGLRNARVAIALTPGAPLSGDADGMALADIQISQGRIVSLLPAGTPPAAADAPYIDLGGGIALPCLVDVHTHLDKGQIWPRMPNPDGTFAGALAAVGADRTEHWSTQDVRLRMEFGLACAYAHGSSAMRTHIDSIGPQIGISWPVLAELRAQWHGRVDLQASPLFGINFALDDTHMAHVTAALEAYGSGILGAVTYMDPLLETGLKRLFRLAADKGWDLDFHVDETKDPAACSLRMIAEMAIAEKFGGRILAGHCCSLAMQPVSEADRTMDLVARAGISVVSLPMCNLYLQDRQANITPRWRGVSLLHELKARGVPVMIASDNTRDPFYAYGDLDMLEVYRDGTRILHLDHPWHDWLRTVASNPADVMGLGHHGRLRQHGPADLILTSARSLTELLARPQADRCVVRAGRAIADAPPPYAFLDTGYRLKP